MEHGDDCCEECAAASVVAIFDVSDGHERKAWRNLKLTPQELRERALKGWITRRRGGTSRTEIPRPVRSQAKPQEPSRPRKVISSGRPSGKLTPKQRAQQRAQNINQGKPTHSGSQGSFFPQGGGGQQGRGGSRGSGKPGGQSGQNYRNRGWTTPKNQAGDPPAPPKKKYVPPPPPAADPNAGVPKSRTAPLTDAEAWERERWFTATLNTPEWGHNGPHDTVVANTDPATGAWTAERQALHQKLLTDRIVAALNRKVPQEHRAILVTGQSGSGKSTALTKPEVVAHLGLKVGADGNPDNFVLVDADEFKPDLLNQPDFQVPPGLTREEASYLVHEESLRLASALAETAKQAGLNYVLNITGGDYDRAVSTVQDMKAAGYRVDGMHVDISIDKAAKSARKRWRDGLDRLEVDGQGMGGRFVPASRIRRVGQLGRNTPKVPDPDDPTKLVKARSAHRGVFQSLENMGLLNKVIVIDNEGDGSTDDYPNKVVYKA